MNEFTALVELGIITQVTWTDVTTIDGVHRTRLQFAYKGKNYRICTKKSTPARRHLKALTQVFDNVIDEGR